MNKFKRFMVCVLSSILVLTTIEFPMQVNASGFPYVSDQRQDEFVYGTGGITAGYIMCRPAAKLCLVRFDKTTFVTEDMTPEKVAELEETAIRNMAIQGVGAYLNKYSDNTSNYYLNTTISGRWVTTGSGRIVAQSVNSPGPHVYMGCGAWEYTPYALNSGLTNQVSNMWMGSFDTSLSNMISVAQYLTTPTYLNELKSWNKDSDYDYCICWQLVPVPCIRTASGQNASLVDADWERKYALGAWDKGLADESTLGTMWLSEYSFDNIRQVAALKTMFSNLEKANNGLCPIVYRYVMDKEKNRSASSITYGSNMSADAKAAMDEIIDSCNGADAGFFSSPAFGTTPLSQLASAIFFASTEGMFGARPYPYFNIESFESYEQSVALRMGSLGIDNNSYPIVTDWLTHADYGSINKGILGIQDSDPSWNGGFFRTYFRDTTKGKVYIGVGYAGTAINSDGTPPPPDIEITPYGMEFDFTLKTQSYESPTSFQDGDDNYGGFYINMKYADYTPGDGMSLEDYLNTFCTDSDRWCIEITYDMENNIASNYSGYEYVNYGRNTGDGKWATYPSNPAVTHVFNTGSNTTWLSQGNSNIVKTTLTVPTSALKELLKGDESLTYNVGIESKDNLAYVSNDVMTTFPSVSINIYRRGQKSATLSKGYAQDKWEGISGCPHFQKVDEHTGQTLVSWKEFSVDDIPWGYSSPNGVAYAEIIANQLGYQVDKDGNPIRDAEGNTIPNADWSVLSGVPSTENLCIAVGGTSFVYDAAGYIRVVGSNSGKSAEEKAASNTGNGTPQFPISGADSDSNRDMYRKITFEVSITDIWGTVESAAEGGNPRCTLSCGGHTYTVCSHTGTKSCSHSGGQNCTYCGATQGCNSNDHSSCEHDKGKYNCKCTGESSSCPHSGSITYYCSQSGSGAWSGNGVTLSSGSSTLISNGQRYNGSVGWTCSSHSQNKGSGTQSHTDTTLLCNGYTSEYGCAHTDSGKINCTHETSSTYYFYVYETIDAYAYREILYTRLQSCLKATVDVLANGEKLINPDDIKRIEGEVASPPTLAFAMWKGAGDYDSQFPSGRFFFTQFVNPTMSGYESLLTAGSYGKTQHIKVNDYLINMYWCSDTTIRISLAADSEWSGYSTGSSTYNKLAETIKAGGYTRTRGVNNSHYNNSGNISSDTTYKSQGAGESSSTNDGDWLSVEHQQQLAMAAANTWQYLNQSLYTINVVGDLLDTMTGEPGVRTPIYSEIYGVDGGVNLFSEPFKQVNESHYRNHYLYMNAKDLGNNIAAGILNMGAGSNPGRNTSTVGYNGIITPDAYAKYYPQGYTTWSLLDALLTIDSGNAPNAGAASKQNMATLDSYNGFNTNISAAGLHYTNSYASNYAKAMNDEYSNIAAYVVADNPLDLYRGSLASIPKSGKYDHQLTTMGYSGSDTTPDFTNGEDNIITVSGYYEDYNTMLTVDKSPDVAVWVYRPSIDAAQIARLVGDYTPNRVVKNNDGSVTTIDYAGNRDRSVVAKKDGTYIIPGSWGFEDIDMIDSAPNGIYSNILDVYLNYVTHYELGSYNDLGQDIKNVWAGQTYGTRADRIKAKYNSGYKNAEDTSDTLNDVVIHTPTSVEYSQVVGNNYYDETQNGKNSLTLSNGKEVYSTDESNEDARIAYEGIEERNKLNYIVVGNEFKIWTSDFGDFYDFDGSYIYDKYSDFRGVGSTDSASNDGTDKTANAPKAGSQYPYAKGYSADMDTDVWTKARFVSFSFPVSYVDVTTGKIVLVEENTKIDLEKVKADFDTYAYGSDALENFRKDVGAVEGTDENTVVYDSMMGDYTFKYGKLYTFTCLPQANEDTSAEVTFYSYSLNNPEAQYDEKTGKFKDNSVFEDEFTHRTVPGTVEVPVDNNGDGKPDLDANGDAMYTIQQANVSEEEKYNLGTNKLRNAGYSDHYAMKTVNVELVGRIGNLAIEDTTDFRFSNLFKRPTSEWLINGVIKKVDTSKPLTIGATPYNIMYELCNVPNGITHSTFSTSNYGVDADTYFGTGKAGTFFELPLTSTINTVEEYIGDEMKLGYNVLMDVELVGNYDFVNPIRGAMNVSEMENDARSYVLEITPSYYLLDLDEYKASGGTNGLYMIDLYAGSLGNYELLYRSGDNTINHNVASLYTDLPQESERRNIPLVEDYTTRRVVNAFSSLDKYKDITDASLTDADFIGTSSKIVLDQYNRTYIGSSIRNGAIDAIDNYGNIATTLANIKDVKKNALMASAINMSVSNYTLGNASDLNAESQVSNIAFASASMRYHFTLGLPSSTYVTGYGSDANQNSIEKSHTKLMEEHPNSVIICFADFVAKGEVWDLHANTELMYGKDNVIIKVTKKKNGMPVIYNVEPEGMTPVDPDTDSDGNKGNDDSITEYDIPLFIMDPWNSSSDDLDIFGTH